ncbi:hypothetical protein ASC95_11120 [Pelomonas sp. Root1217]|nr:hypothetical protein ASC95_11120 [Pelomonas sp. Root1217]
MIWCRAHRVAQGLDLVGQFKRFNQHDLVAEVVRDVDEFGQIAVDFSSVAGAGEMPGRRLTQAGQVRRIVFAGCHWCSLVSDRRFALPKSATGFLDTDFRKHGDAGPPCQQGSTPEPDGLLN